jgi:hypothetical protein
MKRQPLLLATLLIVASAVFARAMPNGTLAVAVIIDCEDVRVDNRFNEIIRTELGKIPDVVIVNNDALLGIHVHVLVLQNSTLTYSFVVLDHYTEWSSVCNSGVNIEYLREGIHKVGKRGLYTMETNYVGYCQLSTLKESIGSIITYVNSHDFQDVRLARLNFVANPNRWKAAPTATPTLQTLVPAAMPNAPTSSTAP